MKAYPTVFEGVEYRSRLEAKWAAFFAKIGWRTIYEPFDAEGYIPDFLIEGQRPLLVEIKPATLLNDYFEAVPKSERGLRSHWDHDVLIVGLTPVPGLLDGTAAADSESHCPAGVLGQFLGDTASRWAWDTGVWFKCEECGGIGVYHQLLSWAGRPCGHYDGDHLLGHVPAGTLEDHWARASRDVMWRAKDA